MDYLKPEYWLSFKGRAERYDGVKFEDLVSHLLPQLEESIWRSTSASWDGSRDFETVVEGKQVWAECKIYRDRLSIRVISPTLVMAIIDKADVIFFFSYSPLNRNARRHLSHYQFQTGKQIRIFDDVTLETLILQNALCLQKFFPDLRWTDSLKAHSLSTSVHFSKDPDVEYFEESDGTPAYLEKGWILRYSNFCIDIFLKNLDPIRGVTGRIQVFPNAFDQFFALLNKKVKTDEGTIQFELPGAGVLFYRLYFKALRPGKNIALPKVTIRSEEIDLKIEAYTNPKKVDVSSILSSPLIGKNALENARKFEQVISNRNKAIFVQVHGASGTGKSRLLREFRESIYVHGFRLISLDAEGGSVFGFQGFIQKVLAKLFKLPLFYATSDTNDAINSSNSAGYSSLLMNALYDSTFKASEHIEQCVDLVVQGLREERVGLIIDNIQNLDESTISFLEALITRLRDVSSRLVAVLCVNSDLVFDGTKVKQLHSELLSQSSVDTSQFYSFEVTEFSCEDVTIYVNHCLMPEHRPENSVPFSRIFFDSVQLLIDKVLPRPLFIEQTLLLLEDRGALTRYEDRFFIADPDLYHKSLNEIPDNIHLLLQKRWDIIQKRIGHKAEELIEMLSMLGAVRSRYLCHSREDVEVFRQLESAGILKMSEEGISSFYHLQIFLFFRSNNRNLLPSRASSFCDFIEEHGLSNQFFYQYFHAAEIAGRLNPEMVASATKLIQQSPPYNEFLVAFIRCYNEVALRPEYEDLLPRRLIALRHSGILIKLYEGYGVGKNAFAEMYKQLISNPTSVRPYGESYLDFVHEYANSCIAIYEDTEALQLLDETIANVTELSFDSDRTRDLKKAFLLNRLGVIYKSLKLHRDALEKELESLSIAKKWNEPELQLQNHIDIANIYGRSYKHKDDIVNHWRSAIDIFEENQAKIPSVRRWRAMLKLHQSQFLLTIGEVEESFVLIEDSIKYCNATFDHFFGVKFLLMKILISLLHPELLSKPVVLATINSAYDKCVRYKVNRSYWKVFWFEAILHRSSGDFHSAAASYIAAILQFLKIAKHPGIEQNHKEFLIEAIVILGANKDILSNDQLKKLLAAIELLQNEDLRDRVTVILNETTGYCQALIEDRSPEGFFHDGRFNYPQIG
jgi:hypothetical protein